MQRTPWLSVLAAGILAAGQAPGAAPPRAEDDTQRLVFLDDSGPVLLELHLRLDGRSFRSAWRDFMNHLFDSLDSDGRPSGRELRNLARLLGRLDVDGDGLLAPAEVPRHYRGTFVPGSLSAATAGQRFVLVGNVSWAQQPLPRHTRGPLWFRKMALNHDGDVSPREWLGTLEQFKKIDTDGDGLISAEEAEASDRRERAKKK